MTDHTAPRQSALPALLAAACRRRAPPARLLPSRGRQPGTGPASRATRTAPASPPAAAAARAWPRCCRSARPGSRPPPPWPPGSPPPTPPGPGASPRRLAGPAAPHDQPAQLYAALAQAAATPGVLAQRDHARQAAAGTVTAAQIRDLTPGSVTFTVQPSARSSPAPAAAASGQHDLAVTLTPAGGGWAVYDIEPAAPGTPDGAPRCRARPLTAAASRSRAAIAAVVVLLAVAAPRRRRRDTSARQAAACTAQPAPSTAAATIPAPTSPTTSKPEPQYGIPWTVLAGIGEVESGNGRSDAPGRALRHQRRRGGRADAVRHRRRWPGTPGAAPPSTPPPSTPAGTASTATTTASSTSTTPATPSPPPRASSRPTAPPPTSRPRCSPTTTPARTSPTSWTGPPATPPAAPRPLTAASSPLCQQAALGPLPAGTAGKVIAYAEAQLGKPYQWGATGPDAFDCSGLAMMAYRAAGITIPRTSQQQWAYGQQIPAIPGPARRPGLLRRLRRHHDRPRPRRHRHPGHDTMIDAPQTGQAVPGELRGSTDLVGFTRP